MATFWIGDTVEGGSKDARTPRYGAPLAQAAPATVWGVTVPLSLLVSAALGLWLMAAPAIFQSGGFAADNDHLVGALAVTIAVIVMAEVVRVGRLLNVLLGFWLVISSWVLSAPTGARADDVMTGIALILLSLPRGEVRERYGTWDRHII